MSIFSAPSFYSQVDQDIYNQGNRFITQEPYRGNIPVNSISNDITDSISFNANFFKEILVANKECTEAIFKISTEGLSKLEFKVDDYTSTYFLVASEDVD